MAKGLTLYMVKAHERSLLLPRRRWWAVQVATKWRIHTSVEPQSGFCVLRPAAADPME